MSQTIRATPRSAGFSSSRIDLLPSRRAAIAWFAWLALVCAITLCAVALPLIVRMALCVLVAMPGIRTVCSFVMLIGPRSVRVIEWTGATLTILVGPDRQPLAATWGDGSFRPGRHWLALTFDTPAGKRQVLVDGRYQDARAFRRLCCEFSRSLKGSSGRDSGTS
ncbi:MAG: hypothetical protein H7Y89_03660 [Steroidobacteraceae bacterium]|nr:hypothetical protein [Steroidobacteraceae bacterium]